MSPKEIALIIARGNKYGRVGLKNPDELVMSAWLLVNWYRACYSSEVVGALRVIGEENKLYDGGVHTDRTLWTSTPKISYSIN